MTYSNWEFQVIRILEEKLECTTSDAQGVWEAQEFYQAQCWGRDLNPEETANLIIEKSTVN